MKKLRITLLFVAFCLLTSELDAQPKLTVVGGTTVEFGNVYYAKKVSRKVQILNAGDEDLVVTEIDTFCGCTQAKITSKRIAPNTNAVLTLTFDGKLFQGNISKAIHVQSNDPSLPVAVIMFTANVFKLLDIDPEYIYFGVVPVDSTVTRTLKVKNISPDNLSILRVVAKDAFVHAKVKSTTLEPGKETELVATATPHKSMTIRGQLELLMNSNVDPKIKVRYTGLATIKK